MSCYFRHIKGILDEARISLTSANRKQIDQAVHQIVEVAYKDCPETWRRLKREMLSDEQKRKTFISKLQPISNSKPCPKSTEFLRRFNE